MVSEFSSLLDKVSQLAELMLALRRENADLRNEVVTLADENARLSSRMKEAHDRVSALIDTMPSSSDQEAA
jgi:regulator of replication initiation timing